MSSEKRKPENAFILAAGKGTRMKPHTDTKPKPMVELAGRPLIDHTIDALIAAGVKNIVVNLHYFGNQLENHLKQRTDVNISFSKEPALLDTGGGVRKAARMLGDDPFFVLSGDGFWTEGPDSKALERMAESWDPDKMDILILLQKAGDMELTAGVGDYTLDKDGRATRSSDKSGDYMFTSIRIMRPEILRGSPEGAFSYLDLLDRAQEEGRLYGLVHDGHWHHISTPADLEKVDASLSQQGAA